MGGLEIIFIGLLVALLLPLTLIDLQQRRIPNLLNFAIAVVGLAHALIRNPGWHTLVIALIQASSTFAILGITVRLMRMASPYAEIGGGDLKFLTAATFWVGIDGSVAILVVACLVHVVAVLIMMPWQGFERHRMRPFGPMLAVGALTVVLAAFLRQGGT